MVRALDPKKIKSAQRVLEILEYFNQDRPEATVMDIARSMGYPQSSTSELLSCLVALGYLHRDRRARTYRPAARVALIGAWIQPALFRCGTLPAMMDALADETGMTVVLATKVGLEVQYIHAVGVHDADRDNWLPGSRAPILHSTAGRALLSTTNPDLIRKIVHRLNAESPAEMRVSADTLLANLKTVRAQGYALGTHESGAGMVVVLLPQPASKETLALGICGPAAEITTNTDDYVRMLRAAVARQFGPVTATSQPAPARAPTPLRLVSCPPVHRASAVPSSTVA